ncbi:MAG: hypothetical protein ABFR05_08825 [Bacteroidota bacterium]
MKRTLIFIIFFCINLLSFGQHKDYENITFKSKLRNYSKSLPKTEENGITKELVSEITNLLTFDGYTEKEKKELDNRIWLALSNPKKFDFVYKNYSINTIKNWGVKIKFEDPNFEPNPFLAKWTNSVDDMIYFQWVWTNILTYEGLLSYGDEAKTAYKGIQKLIHVKNIKFPPPKSGEYADTYLRRMNGYTKQKNLIILMFANNFDFLVCKIEDEEKLVELFQNFHWLFIEP